MKDAAGTRRRVLLAAFSEIHAHGFQAASLERVLRAAGVTKGALYHHFASKHALGLAVVSELLAQRVDDFTRTLVEAPDPLTALCAWVNGPPWIDVRLGCPVNNLAQEMSAVDEAFRAAVEAVFEAWRAGIESALRRAQHAGQVRAGVDVAGAASFILAGLEGSISLAKSARDETLFFANMKLLSEFIEGLRERSEKGVSDG